MRLFGTVNSTIDGSDRAAYLTPPFDRTLVAPAVPPAVTAQNGVPLEPQVQQPTHHEAGEGST